MRRRSCKALSRSSRPVAALAALFVLGAATVALAAVPPLETASKRLASLRAEADLTFDVSMSVTDGGMREYRGASITFADAEPIELTTRDKERKLVLDAAKDAPWNVVWVLLASPDPVVALQERIGQIDPSNATVETIDDAFVYAFGDAPRVAFSRDLTHIRRVEFHSGGHAWQLRLDGELGDSGLGERIHVIRSGQPYATIELSRATQHVQPNKRE